VNRVYIVYRNYEVFKVYSTETLAQICVNIESQKNPSDVFGISEMEVTR
jgi:hypothetical protein